MSEKSRNRSPTLGDGEDKPQMLKDFVDRVMTLCTAMLAVIETLDEKNMVGEDESTVEAGGNAANSKSNEVGYLKAELKKIATMNVSWQTTHQRQQETIQQLKDQVHQLTEELNHRGGGSGSSGALTEEQQADVDRLLLQQKRQYAELDEQKCQLEEQNRGLVERVSMLELQVTTYREDFETERRDRERAQGQVDELKQLLNAGAHRYVGQPGRPLYQTDLLDGDRVVGTQESQDTATGSD